MPDLKISQLTATTIPLNADLLAIVTAGVTKKITYANLIAGINTVSGLTTNYVVKSASASTFGNSSIFDNGTSVAIGNASPTASTKFEVNSTTGAILFPRMTTAQRNALTPLAGMVVHNTTLFTFDGYAAGSWYNFIGTNLTNVATFYPKFISSTTIGQGLLSDDGTRVIVPQNKLISSYTAGANSIIGFGPSGNQINLDTQAGTGGYGLFLTQTANSLLWDVAGGLENSIVQSASGTEIYSDGTVELNPLLTLVSSPIKISSGTPGVGKVLTSDATGNATWVAVGSGTVTSVAWTTSQGVSASIANATTTPNITITLGALTGVTSFNGLVVTANTGAITTGSWAATVIPGQYGGTGVANTGFTITLAGNLATTGAFNSTFAASATATYTLPTATSTLLAASLGISGGTTIIGGTGTTDDLNLQATSGAGTTGSFINFKVGNNGAITAACITDKGLIGIGRDVTTLPAATGGYTGPMYTIDAVTCLDNADGSINPGNCTISLRNFSGTTGTPASYYSNIKLASNRGTPTVYTMPQNGDVLGSVYFGTTSTVAGTIGYFSTGAEIRATSLTNWNNNNDDTMLQWGTAAAGVSQFYYTMLPAGQSIFTLEGFSVGTPPTLFSTEVLSVQKNDNTGCAIYSYQKTSGTGALASVGAVSSTGKLTAITTTSAGFTAAGAGALSADKSVLDCRATNGTSIYNGSANPTTFYNNGIATTDAVISLDANHNVILNAKGSALATTATNGFVYLPTAAGNPTGTPATLPTGAIGFQYNTTDHKLMAYDGLWYALTPALTRVSTQFDAAATTTLANVTGLTANVVAGKSYKFEAVLHITADTVGGLKVAIAGTATATAIIYQTEVISDTSNALAISARHTALASSSGVSLDTIYYVYIEGLITVNAAGTLTVQFAQNAASGTSSVLVGSTFTVTQII